MAKDLSEINKILKDYASSIGEQINEIANQVTTEGVIELQQTSPRRNAKGKKYYKGWRVNKQVTGNDYKYTIYNATQPGLAHLLEDGHVGKNQYGQWGFVKGQKHIKPVDETVTKKFETLVTNVIKKGGK